jgi:hypothetical protein
MTRPLSQTHRRLAAQWHPVRNARLGPTQVTAGSGRPIWWKCPKGPDHERQATVASRTSRSGGAGCPFCSGRRVSATNSLATRFPQVAAQWHPTKNGRLRPSDVTARTGRAVWWKCPKGPDHEWRAVVGNRTSRGVGCPYCAGHRASVTNSLATRFPPVAAEWHPTRNGRLTPRQVTPGSAKAVWWRCRHDPTHIWLASPLRRSRTFPKGCPFCSGRHYTRRGLGSLAASFPRLAQHWHPTWNGRRTIDQLARRSDPPAWWRCPSNPEQPWEATLQSWFQSTGGCPFCVPFSIAPARSLAFRSPGLAAEWHPTKNGKLTPEDVPVHSAKKVWWRCRRHPGHVWAASVARRTRGARARSRGCPFCAYRRRAPDNSLAARLPALAAQWHPTRNGRLRPDQVGVSSRQRVWWRCPRGPDHVWAATILSRVQHLPPSGCPFCARRQVSVTNSLARRAPAIAAQWHPTKNGALRPDQVDAHADMRVWWRCSKGPDHVWASRVRNRTRSQSPTGCPYCAGRRLSVTNSLAARFPELARQWQPTKNGALRPDRVLAGSHRKVWWRCPRGPDHEWCAEVKSRTGRRRLGCPACRGLKVSVTNSLAARYPAVAAWWHPTKNHPLTPDQITAGSHKAVWWACPTSPRHAWRRKVQHMVRSPRCPVCRQ